MIFAEIPIRLSRGEEERERLMKPSTRTSQATTPTTEVKVAASPMAPEKSMARSRKKRGRTMADRSVILAHKVREVMIDQRPLKFFVLAATLIVSLTCKASDASRIQSINFDMSKVQTMHLSPGLASVIHFPCEIEEAFVGRVEDLKVQISPTSKKVLTLFLNKSAASPTNLLVKCEASENLFVFDVLPSQSRHQDFLRVRKGFNEPEMREELSQAQKLRERTDRAITQLLKRGRTANQAQAKLATELPKKGERHEVLK